MVLWLAGRAGAHQWSGCAHGTWEQWPCGEERAGKELAQQTAPHQETPARGPRPHTPSASGVCVPDGDGRVQGVRTMHLSFTHAGRCGEEQSNF